MSFFKPPIVYFFRGQLWCKLFSEAAQRQQIWRGMNIKHGPERILPALNCLWGGQTLVVTEFQRILIGLRLCELAEGPAVKGEHRHSECFPHSNCSVLNRVTANFCGKSQWQCVIFQSAPWERPERRCASVYALIVLGRRILSPPQRHGTQMWNSERSITADRAPGPGIDPPLHSQFVFSAR